MALLRKNQYVTWSCLFLREVVGGLRFENAGLAYPYLSRSQDMQKFVERREQGKLKFHPYQANIFGQLEIDGFLYSEVPTASISTARFYFNG